MVATMSQPLILFTVRMTPELRARLESYDHHTRRRSLNASLNVLLAAALDAWEHDRAELDA